VIPIHLKDESFILQAYWLHLQVISVHLWGGSFSPLGDARKLHPYKPWLE